MATTSYELQAAQLAACRLLPAASGGDVFGAENSHLAEFVGVTGQQDMLSEKLAKAIVKSRANEDWTGANGASLTSWSLPEVAPAESLEADAQPRLEVELDGLVRHARFLTSADGAMLALNGEGGLACCASFGLAPAKGVRLDPRRGMCGHCFASRKVVVWSTREATATGIAAVLAVPVRGAATVEGVIAAFSRNPEAFSAGHLAALRRIGKLVSREMASWRSKPPAAVPATSAAVAPAIPAAGASSEAAVPALPEADSGTAVGALRASGDSEADLHPGRQELDLESQSAPPDSSVQAGPEAGMQEAAPEEALTFNFAFGCESAIASRRAYVLPAISVSVVLVILFSLLVAVSLHS
jgi:hypothetical protein